MATTQKRRKVASAPESADYSRKTLEQLTKLFKAEIAHLERVSKHIYRTGAILTAIKAKIGHTKWLKWLKDNSDLSSRQAQRYIRVAKNWSQIREAGLEGESLQVHLLFLAGPDEEEVRVVPVHNPKPDDDQSEPVDSCDDSPVINDIGSRHELYERPIRRTNDPTKKQTVDPQLPVGAPDLKIAPTPTKVTVSIYITSDDDWFEPLVERLKKRFKKDNTTDAILAAMRHADPRKGSRK